MEELKISEWTMPTFYHTSTMDEAKKAAAQQGLKVEYPEKNELFIDIDSEQDLLEYFRNKKQLEEELRFHDEKITPSKSGEPGHVHVRLKVDHTLHYSERIALQAVLGSHRLREAHSLVAMYRGEATPTIFFEK